MSSQVWSRFRKIRAIIFAFSTLLTIAWTIIFTILLLRQWSTYNMGQRATVLVLLSINGVSSILTYLMIVVRFTLWIDGVRITLILVFQLGGTISFALLNPRFPCNNLGSINDCKNVTLAVIMGGWTLSGLLLFYAFLLAIMSYIPPSVPLPNPEDALSASRERSSLNRSPTPSINSETYLMSVEKHRSTDSSSFYCCGPYTSLASLVPTNRLQPHPPSLDLPYASSLHSTWSQKSHSQSPIAPTRPSHESLHPQQVLSNPFTDPVPRHTSPLSQASVSSSRSESSNRKYTYVGQFPRIIGTNSPFPRVYHINSTLPPPYKEERRAPYWPQYSFSSPLTPDSPGNLVVPSTPISLRPAVPANIPFRKCMTSPGYQSVHSMAASMHSPSRSISFSTSRIPSPVLPPAPGLPSSPRPVMIPLTTTPRIKGVAQIRRFGSDSNIAFNAQHQSSGTRDMVVPSALRVKLPDGRLSWVSRKSDRNVDLKQWKEAVLGAASGGQVRR
ncbi:hypothetical protein BDZ94DRAFT_352575 [Collybia nuda]|uniref:Uncharacterized protein n=1 Tax=Collybia nuda TaxID=64659 RepID=A0A9P5XS14_9AGAR|nr:hypothetical protein BDZ94DRAFT_352575 [Collybia nuda]